MKKLNYQCIIYERLKRQRLIEPVSDENEEEYISLFRLLQPVAPVHFSRPGDPPKLVHRVCFDDTKLSNELRERHRIVKGRFSGGRVGYVLQEDLKYYAIAFRKPLTKIKPIHQDIMNLIRASGGISKAQLKEELPYSNRQIMKALKDLHEAFWVYEEQIDTDWDTGWFDFSTEWFKIPTDEKSYYEAMSFILLNFLKAMVFASTQQIKDWTQLNVKTIREILRRLVNEEKIVYLDISGFGQGYMCTDDLTRFEDREKPRSVFMLDKSDFLVRSHMSELRKRYHGQKILQYLLIDGEFKGAVLGHWRIGPKDIEDILLDLDDIEAEKRQAEIINAVRKIYPPGSATILRYNGQQMEGII